MFLHTSHWRFRVIMQGRGTARPAHERPWRSEWSSARVCRTAAIIFSSTLSIPRHFVFNPPQPADERGNENGFEGYQAVPMVGPQLSCGWTLYPSDTACQGSNLWLPGGISGDKREIYRWEGISTHIHPCSAGAGDKACSAGEVGDRLRESFMALQVECAPMCLKA